MQLSEDYAARARQSMDIDEPSIDALQTLLLLVLAFIASGKGKKAHMLMGKTPRVPNSGTGSLTLYSKRHWYGDSS